MTQRCIEVVIEGGGQECVGIEWILHTLLLQLGIYLESLRMEELVDWLIVRCSLT